MRSRHIDEDRLADMLDEDRGMAWLDEPVPFKRDEDGEVALSISFPEPDDLYYVDSAWGFDALAPRSH